MEIIYEISGDNARTLSEIANARPEADVEYHSGMGGLEILGTIAIPSLALALQILSMVRDFRKNDPTIRITNLHVHNGDNHISIKVEAGEDVEAKLLDTLDKLK